MYTQFIFSSSTQAHKARRILGRSGLPSEMQKTLSSAGGCVFALSIRTSLLREAMAILKESELPFEIKGTKQP